MDTYPYVLDCLVYSIKNRHYFKNDASLLVKEFKKRNLIITEKLAEDIDDLYYEIRSHIKIHKFKLTEDYILNTFCSSLKTFSPSPEKFDLGALPELKMRLFKMAMTILYIPDLNRQQIICKSLELGDISTLVTKYDAHFEGKTIFTSANANNYGYTVSALFGNRIIIGTKDNSVLTIQNILKNEVESTLDVEQDPSEFLVIK